MDCITIYNELQRIVTFLEEQYSGMPKRERKKTKHQHFDSYQLEYLRELRDCCAHVYDSMITPLEFQSVIEYNILPLKPKVISYLKGVLSDNQKQSLTELGVEL